MDSCLWTVLLCYNMEEGKMNYYMAAELKYINWQCSRRLLYLLYLAITQSIWFWRLSSVNYYYNIVIYWIINSKTVNLQCPPHLYKSYWAALARFDGGIEERHAE